MSVMTVASPVHGYQAEVVIRLALEAGAVLGRASPRTTERYAHFARTFQPPKALSWVQQTVMQDDRVNSEPGA